MSTLSKDKSVAGVGDPSGRPDKSKEVDEAENLLVATAERLVNYNQN
jgi:hypothetical protein